MDPSSGRDRDPKSSSSDPEPENPFVKFRRTVDSQVSSLLQGIIGLPSAFSKRSGDDNRWADIDEDLRRRDQQQARQETLRKQLSEADSTKSEPADTEDAQHTLKDYQMQVMLLEQQNKKRLSMASAEQEMMAREKQERLRAEHAVDEVEIPVKKSYQQRAPQTPDQLRPYWGSSDGSKQNIESEQQNDPNVKDLPLFSPVTLELFDHLKQLNSSFSLRDATHEPLEATRHLTLGFLQKSPLYRADYSLLPYLLFSPYSPLKLSADARVPDTRTRDQFPYCSAFEDLIQTSEGSKVGHQREDLILSSWTRTSPWKAGRTVYDNWTWITNLYFRGLLQQKQSVPYTPVTWLSPMSALAATIIDDPNAGPGSELEMFEHKFGLMGGSSAEQKQWHKVFDILFSGLPEWDSQGSGLEEMIEQARRRAELESRQIRDAQESQVRTYSKEEKSQSTDGRATKNASDTERIVSTSTTTERTTHEDGTVETCVTVWKQYGDGRETTTMTHHTEDPGRDGPEYDWREVEEKEANEAKNDEKSEKKGWFWN
ncbi:uncharacterized protein PAC_06219 [Phialocephala subalpina]|uniref:Uncharacterized protein n=1 Tax=Phialocephala subalpina TaxID=576137 RepID=A0A1L7WU69_9HELO|nr:uncharacterized protein PAC_06219 [Phialocephala subalpina]